MSLRQTRGGSIGIASWVRRMNLERRPDSLIGSGTTPRVTGDWSLVLADGCWVRCRRRRNYHALSSISSMIGRLEPSAATGCVIQHGNSKITIDSARSRVGTKARSGTSAVSGARRRASDRVASPIVRTGRCRRPGMWRREAMSLDRRAV